MPSSGQRGVEGAIWPPDYSKYTQTDLLKVLQEESNSVNAPKSYRDVLTKLASELRTSQIQLEANRAKIEALSSKSNQYGRYVKAAEDNYGNLAELYKSEHKANLDHQDEILDLKTKLKVLEDSQTIKQDRFKQQAELMQRAFTEKFELQKEEFTKAANKQALGRRNLEDKMMMKENELSDLRNKVQDADTRLTQLEAQRMEKVKENVQLKALIQYLQPQQQVQNVQMSAQQIQQPQQQHIQTHPLQQPHNNNRY